MVKTQIGLGVLSIPSAFHVLGMIPGIICLILIAVITTWSNYIVGVFKLRHRAVYGIDDAGGLMFGRIGKEFFAAAFCLCKTPLRPFNVAKTVCSCVQSCRLDLCGRFRHAGYLHRAQRCVQPCDMYRRIRRRCCHNRIQPG